ncbi:sulfate transporter 4.1, chloroplastic isoform X8 [Sorghum bicolor]|uniref:sulfate transporter 4.1, chloroplastic isoform X8 n=1 Tax=Sorghum bicolor TaxID=4558 RepID=UPI000B426753|nr:sulfate transporter 4.1, chloroplastic isoform X8 [Sorghum bicolor]|eukprot:XP_021308784.1 sulfate transporter 4.1, chloroplastic isoform X8 [Sorghum bicolor]
MERSSYASRSSSELAAAASGGGRTLRVIPMRHPLGSGSTSSSSSPWWRAAVGRARAMGPLEWAEAALPCVAWTRKYRWKEDLQADLAAGITVGVMLVPQAMSYAKLSGLHPIYGLYTGFVPLFVYAIFGSSRQLAVGPVALVSLLVSNVLGGIVNPSSELYTELAILLALMVGILECLMGLLRLGWLIRFISHSVISGFTTASAIVIGLSQIKYFLGYNVTRSSKIIPLIESIIAGADEFSWPPFVMGSTFLAILLIMKNRGKSNKRLRFLRASGPLTAVVLGTIFVKIFHPPAISVLFGLGIANICGSFFSSYPATGSFSRSAVNHESGAKTGLSGIIMGIIIGSALLFMTPLFTDIPQCALAAIVISAVTGLVDYEEAIFLWSIDKKDFFLWAITFITTLVFGIEIGVLVGVAFSLAFVIHESANPHIAVLGRLPGTTVYRNTLQYPEAYTYNGIVVVRIDAPIYFANISYIKDRLREYELNLPSSNKGLDVGRVYFVILEMSPVTYIDSSAVQALKDLHQEYKARHIQIAIANPNQQVHLLLSRSGIIDLIGAGWCFVRVHDAVHVCLQHVQNSSSNALKLAVQASGELSDSVSTPKPEKQHRKYYGFFKNLWKARDYAHADGEVQPLLRQNLV